MEINYLNYRIETIISDYKKELIDSTALNISLESILLLNEGTIDDIKSYIAQTKNSGEEALIKTCVIIYTKALGLLSDFNNFSVKLFNILYWIFNKIKNLKEKHPIFYKLIQITLILIVLFIISSSAHASDLEEVSKPIRKINLAKDFNLDMDKLNTLLGTLNQSETESAMKSQAMLVDLKDGVIDGPWSKKDISDTINVTMRAYKHTYNLFLKQSGIDNATAIANNLKKAGENIINFNYQHAPGSESIKIIHK